MVLPHALHRYALPYVIDSILDPIEDVMVLVRSLSSAEYLLDVISSAHVISYHEAKRRAKQIVPHIRTALAYVDQASAGPREVAFLPLYYAFLNLAKVYVLLGGRHAALPQNRWHGAQYAGHAKNSQTLLTEEIRLHKGGAIPLLYETITGHRISSDITLRMSDIYPYVSGIGAEFNLATGQWSRLAGVTFELEQTDSGDQRPLVHVHPLPLSEVRRLDVKLLKSGFRRHGIYINTFVGPTLGSAAFDFSSIRSLFRTSLLYEAGETYKTPLCSRTLLLPEELPILLMFFHLGSVARYKPEFLEKLRDSRFWPVLLASQRHALIRFLSLFWSFVHQRSLALLHGSA